MDFLDKLTRDLRTRRISRRRFMQQGLAAGATVSALSLTADMVHAQTPRKGGHFRVARGHGATTDKLDPGASSRTAIPSASLSAATRAT